MKPLEEIDKEIKELKAHRDELKNREGELRSQTEKIRQQPPFGGMTDFQIEDNREIHKALCLAMEPVTSEYERVHRERVQVEERIFNLVKVWTREIKIFRPHREDGNEQ